MSTYVRPAWPDPVFRDRAGAVMSYGSRWRSDGPPPETYSLVTHSDRFVPLHLVADALIGYLQETYDVQVTWDASYAEDFLRSPDLERVARVTPNDSAAAPLTIGLSTFPGLLLHAGLLHDFAYPACGCDACDETAVGEIVKLESHVFAVVAGHYQETYTPGADLPLVLSCGPTKPGSRPVAPRPTVIPPTCSLRQERDYETCPADGSVGRSSRDQGAVRTDEDAASNRQIAHFSLTVHRAANTGSNSVTGQRSASTRSDGQRGSEYAVRGMRHRSIWRRCRPQGRRVTGRTRHRCRVDRR